MTRLNSINACADGCAPSTTHAYDARRNDSVGCHGRTRQALEPLLCTLREYDALRIQLECEGGRISDFGRITQILTREIHLTGLYHEYVCKLANQPGLRTALGDVGNYDTHLQVRRLGTGMPVYYLSRTDQDYWSEYSLIVEDFYLSPGYPMEDERLARVMFVGHDTRYLRLSAFRDKTREMLKSQIKCDPAEYDVDDLLYTMGRHIFQAAWHDDQRPAMLVAAHFNLPAFRQAVELLYLCLSGELCELRSAANPEMYRFLEVVYPQPAIRDFLNALSTLDGGAINELPQKALKLYAALGGAFSRFVRIEVPWGFRATHAPLYKLVFGNLSHLDRVGAALKSNPDVAQAAKSLESHAQRAIEDLVRSHID
jgi:hypothetical protein